MRLPGEADRQGESEKGETGGGRRQGEGRKTRLPSSEVIEAGKGQERKELKRPIRSGLQPHGVSQNPTIASRREKGI